MHHAASGGHVEVAVLLLNSGASVSNKDKACYDAKGFLHINSLI
jgi:hypothetical protein